MRRPLLRGMALLILLLSASQLAAREADRETLDELNAIRQRIEQNHADWTASLNPIVSNYSREERKILCGALPPRNLDMTEDSIFSGYNSGSEKDFPPYFTWLDLGMVTPIRDQGNCGSCWDFAALGALESSYMIYHNLEYDLSEQQILSCASGHYGCNGGWIEAALQHVRDYGGILEECMPYQADDNIPCTEDDCITVTTLRGWTQIPNNVAAIKEAVMKSPVGVAFLIYSDFYYYSSGCYEHLVDTAEGWHAVVIIGWDDNLCGGEGAWHVKNSWGTWWGEEGFFWIKYNDSYFGTETTLIDLGIVDITDNFQLPQVDMCEDYSFQLHATGGVPPYHWTHVSGMCPPGMSVDSTGLVTGKPEMYGNYMFSVMVRDSHEPPSEYVKEFFLKSTDAANGDANCDEVLNILDIIYLIRYMQKNGPEPLSVHGCDCDASFDCNILDVVYLINYIYHDGPPPVEY